jgi:hypothetical protein
MASSSSSYQGKSATRQDQPTTSGQDEVLENITINLKRKFSSILFFVPAASHRINSSSSLGHQRDPRHLAAPLVQARASPLLSNPTVSSSKMRPRLQRSLSSSSLWPIPRRERPQSVILALPRSPWLPLASVSRRLERQELESEPGVVCITLDFHSSHVVAF